MATATGEDWPTQSVLPAGMPDRVSAAAKKAGIVQLLIAQQIDAERRLIALAGENWQKIWTSWA